MAVRALRRRREVRSGYVAAMAHTVAALRALSDEELIAIHDQAAVNASGGITYYLDELKRRDQERAIASSHRLAVSSFVLSTVNALLAMAAVTVAFLG